MKLMCYLYIFLHRTEAVIVAVLGSSPHRELVPKRLALLLAFLRNLHQEGKLKKGPGGRIGKYWKVSRKGKLMTAFQKSLKALFLKSVNGH
jgi:hypothetical protein